MTPIYSHSPCSSLPSHFHTLLSSLNAHSSFISTPSPMLCKHPCNLYPSTLRVTSAIHSELKGLPQYSINFIISDTQNALSPHLLKCKQPCTSSDPVYFIFQPLISQHKSEGDLSISSYMVTLLGLLSCEEREKKTPKDT